MPTNDAKEIFTERFLNDYGDRFPDSQIDPETVVGIIKALMAIFKECQKRKEGQAKETAYSIRRGKVRGLVARRSLRKAMGQVDSEYLKTMPERQKKQVSESVIEALKASTDQEVESYFAVLAE